MATRSPVDDEQPPRDDASAEAMGQQRDHHDDYEEDTI
jgi:hypothetical protein